jgi:hypothetical protein
MNVPGTIEKFLAPFEGNRIEKKEAFKTAPLIFLIYSVF